MYLSVLNDFIFVATGPGATCLSDSVVTCVTASESYWFDLNDDWGLNFQFIFELSFCLISLLPIITLLFIQFLNFYPAQDSSIPYSLYVLALRSEHDYQTTTGDLFISEPCYFGLYFLWFLSFFFDYLITLLPSLGFFYWS